MTLEEYKEIQIFICRKKITYPSQKKARMAARCIRKKYGRRLKPYRCRVCGCLHLRTVGKVELKDALGLAVNF